MILPSRQAGWPLTVVLGMLLPHFKQVNHSWLIRSSHAVAKYSYGIYLAYPIAIFVGVNWMADVALPLRVPALLISLAVMPVAGHHLLSSP